jgi:hypothetical protein
MKIINSRMGKIIKNHMIYWLETPSTPVDARDPSNFHVIYSSTAPFFASGYKHSDMFLMYCKKSYSSHWLHDSESCPNRLQKNTSHCKQSTQKEKEGVLPPPLLLIIKIFLRNLLVPDDRIGINL